MQPRPSVEGSRGPGGPARGRVFASLGSRLSDPPTRWLAVSVAVGVLVLVGAPIVDIVRQRPGAPESIFAYGMVAAFVSIYLWAIPPDLAGRAVGRPAPATVLLGLLGVMIALTSREANWTVLFVATGTAAGRITPPRTALAAIAVIAMLAALVRLAVDATPVGSMESAFVVTLGGLVVLSFSQLERTARELGRAQAEVARLAAADERARIARDVHDLLGHGLSVIALKAELAGRLLESDPRRAAAELRDLEDVARSSLRDIREAVAGYRRVTLDTELGGARVALSAAGMEVDVQAPTTILEESTDGLLGWIVREGVTNVVRHSSGTRCTISIATLAQEVRLEIVDDGRTGDRRGSDARGRTGSGLAGIRERVEAVGGRVEAGSNQGIGYRLAAWIPVSSETRPSEHP